MEIYRIENVSYAYQDGKTALDRVSFTVGPEESVTIIGANGSGKSTLLFILDGLLKPSAGTVTAFGVPPGDGSGFRQRVSLLFQNPQVQLFSLTVWDELCFGPLQLGLGPAEIEQRATDVLGLMGIGHLRDRGPWNLSSGEMKKVALGSCLTINPDVILLDEPTTGLDPRSQVEFIDLIVGLRRTGKTIITSTHDLGIIEDISDRTIVIGEDHRVMIEDRPWEVLRNTDALLRANLIHSHTHRHAWYEHEHGHSGIHEHEHIPELAAPHPPSPDMEKLRILIGHWMEHNGEHAATYLQWAETADALGSRGIANLLREAAAETARIDRLFAEARRRTGGQDPRS